MKPKYWVVIILILIAATAVWVYFIENRPFYTGSIFVPRHHQTSVPETEDQVIAAVSQAIKNNPLTEAELTPGLPDDCLAYQFDGTSSTDYYFVEVRENHDDPACKGDPNTEPRLFTVEVSKTTGSMTTDAGSIDGTFSPLSQTFNQSAAADTWQSYISPIFHYEITVPSSWQTDDADNTFLDSKGNQILYMDSIYLPQTMTTMANLKIQASTLGWEERNPKYKNISFEKFSEDRNSVIYISEWQNTALAGNSYFLRADLIQKNQVVLPYQNYPKGDITVLTITSVDNTPTTMPFDDMTLFKKIISSFKFPENVNDSAE